MARALELGAVAVRVTGAAAHDGARDAMRASFARGDLATWGYDDAHAAHASEPRQVLAGARSVICVAVPYASQWRSNGNAPLEGRVSNYAWSSDYHHRMRALLSELARCLDEVAGGCASVIACDTKPLAERAFAARAGLAWIGKHTNAIVPGAGSYVFLGEVVTTLELPADEPLRKTCGTCVRCVRACPTGALRGDYTIDATRCISDLTQRTGAIPREVRPLIGLWVWGCDICQEVCPPTARAPRRSNAPDEPLDRSTATPSLVELLQMRSGTFKRLFARTAMGWRGAAVLRRNAAVALGNALDRSSVGALERALQRDPHPMVRGHAAWALGRIASPAALRALACRATSDEDAGVREEIAAALEPFANRTR